MKLHNQVTIKQTITPATIQLLEMVQMNTTELSSYLTEQAMENPAIDIDELGSAAKRQRAFRQGQWLSSFGRDRSEQNIAGDDDTLDSPIASRAQVPDVSISLEPAVKLRCRLRNEKRFTATLSVALTAADFYPRIGEAFQKARRFTGRGRKLRCRHAFPAPRKVYAQGTCAAVLPLSSAAIKRTE